VPCVRRPQGLAYHLSGGRNGNAIDVFIQRTDQNRLPEAFNRLLRLPVILQPGEERLSVIAQWQWNQCGQCPCNRHFVDDFQKRKSQKRGRCMQRRGQSRFVHHRCPSARFDEGHLIEPVNLAIDSDATVELDEIRAAAKQHVLTVVDNLTCAGMLVGRRAPTEIGASLEQGNVEAGRTQRACRRQSGQTASDHGYIGRLCPGLGHYTNRFRNPFPRMTNFSRRVRLTRSAKTS
jgi:hypothetical protein